MKHFFAVPFFTLLILAGCSEAPKAADTRTKDVENIRAAELQANADWTSRDVERIARFWAEDATLLTPGEPAVKGKAAIKTMLKAALADPAFNVKISTEAVEVAKSGEIGYTRGTAAITVTDPRSKTVTTVPHNYVTVFRKQADGNWLAVEDIATTDKAAVVEAKPSAAAPAKVVKAAKRGKAKKATKKKAVAKKRRR